jgi:hypothetical protein
MNVLRFKGWGFGAQRCPGCGRLPQPGEPRVTVVGVWQVWHADCFDRLVTAVPERDRSLLT